MKKTVIILCAAAVGFAAIGCSADKSGDTQQMPPTGHKRDAMKDTGLPPQALDAMKKKNGG